MQTEARTGETGLKAMQYLFRIINEVPMHIKQIVIFGAYENT